MVDVFTTKGEWIGMVSISPMQHEKLKADGSITVIYHTPQLLRNVVGQHSGQFKLYKSGEHIVTDNIEAVKECAEMFKRVALSAVGVPDDG
jgi:hypothetical protein